MYDYGICHSVSQKLDVDKISRLNEISFMKKLPDNIFVVVMM